jgi:transcriptional regulator with XRE-family HTH domain
MSRLFRESREHFGWQAYLSSALTIQDSLTRERIKKQNLRVKEWLEESADAFVYLPQMYSDPSRDADMSPEEIYVLDRWRIAESDFVLANLDLPAFGVGQEVEMACQLGLPIVAYHHTALRPSRIVRGIPVIFVGDGLGVPSRHVIEYREEDYSDLKAALIAAVQQVQRTITPQSEAPSGAPTFSSQLRKAVNNRGLGIEELAHRTGFSKAFIEQLLRDQSEVQSMLEPYEILQKCRMRGIPLDRFTNPGLWVLRQLAEVLECSVGDLIGEVQLDREWIEPLILAGERGVSLGEFARIARDVDFQVTYGLVARGEGALAEQETADRIVDAASRLRSTGE